MSRRDVKTISLLDPEEIDSVHLATDTGFFGDQAQGGTVDTSYMSKKNSRTSPITASNINAQAKALKAAMPISVKQLAAVMFVPKDEFGQDREIVANIKSVMVESVARTNQRRKVGRVVTPTQEPYLGQQAQFDPEYRLNIDARPSWKLREEQGMRPPRPTPHNKR